MFVLPLVASAMLLVPSPSPCPAAAAPGAPALVSAAPCPSASPLRTIGNTGTVPGRKADLIGSAVSASSGTIGQEQIATRPLLRPGEVLEDIPGLVISQHSGGGKANQYYLRGFQLDHGTNLSANIAGVPVNLPSHAHGQGYSDVNYLIPETVGFVEFKKGPYFGTQGDFAVAGGYELSFKNTLAPTISLTAGDFGYSRFLYAGSRHAGAGDLLYAAEIAHDNGSYQRPDEYARYNGLVRYSVSRFNDTLALTGIAYSGAFNSSDQIPQRLVDAGALSRFGSIDPTDGGATYRYAVSGQLTHSDVRGVVTADAYAVVSSLDLFSNFTYNLSDANDYYNVTANPVTCAAAYTTCAPNSGSGPRTNGYSSYCPANSSAPAGAAPGSIVPAAFAFSCGDQREQLDKRVYYGFDVSRSYKAGRSVTTTGAGLRTDNIAVDGLYLTHARQRFPQGTLSDDHIVDQSLYAYVQTELHLGAKLRAIPAVRYDRVNYHVAAYDPANSGRAAQGLVSPKVAVAYAASKASEFYLNFGESFHSNDARGVVGKNDPQTRAPFDSTGTPVAFNTPLTRAAGEEIGYRYWSPSLSLTVSGYQLLLANELIFDGDHGTTSIGGPTVRRGIEIAAYSTPARGLVVDADLATATARFIADPLMQGTAVPESLAGVVSAGITLDRPHYAASFRVRYFGPRNLDQAGDAVSPSTTTLNTQFTAKLAHRTHLTVDIFNLLNSRTADVTYYYGSWTKSDAAIPALANDPAQNPVLGGGGVNDFHFHPSQARTIRLSLTITP